MTGLKKVNIPISARKHYLHLVGEYPLYRKALRVRNYDKKSLKRILDPMFRILKKYQGVGIAAPQIGYPLAIFIVAESQNRRYLITSSKKPFVVINPKIISYSRKTDNVWEGCLSVPALRANVSRSRQIHVEYADEIGIKHNRTLKGFTARIFQHEFDHLQGKLILDKVSGSSEILAEDIFYKKPLHYMKKIKHKTNKT